MTSTEPVLNGPPVNGEHVSDRLEEEGVHEDVSSEPAPPELNQPSQDSQVPTETEQDSNEDVELSDKENENVTVDVNSDEEESAAVHALFDIYAKKTTVTPAKDVTTMKKQQGASPLVPLSVKDQNQRLLRINKDLKNEYDFKAQSKHTLLVTYGKLERKLKRSEVELFDMAEQIRKQNAKHMKALSLQKDKEVELRDEVNNKIQEVVTAEALLSKEKIIHKNTKRLARQIGEQLDAVLERESVLIDEVSDLTDKYKTVHSENMVLQRVNNDLEGKLSNKSAEHVTTLSQVKSLNGDIKVLKTKVKTLEVANRKSLANEIALRKQIVTIKDNKESSKIEVEKIQLRKIALQHDFNQVNHTNKLKINERSAELRVETQGALKQQAQDFKDSKIKKQEMETHKRMAQFNANHRGAPQAFPTDFAGAAGLAVQHEVEQHRRREQERAAAAAAEPAVPAVASPFAAVAASPPVHAMFQQQVSNLFTNLMAGTGNLSHMMPAFPPEPAPIKKKRSKKVAVDTNNDPSQQTLTQMGYSTPNKRIKKNNRKAAPKTSEEEEEEESPDVVASSSSDVAARGTTTTYWNDKDSPIVIASDDDSEDGEEEEDGVDYDNYDKALADMAEADDLARAEDDADDDDADESGDESACDDDEPFQNH